MSVLLLTLVTGRVVLGAWPLLTGFFIFRRPRPNARRPDSDDHPPCPTPPATNSGEPSAGRSAGRSRRVRIDGITVATKARSLYNRPMDPGDILLHYRLVEKIGEGAMGVVWRARDTTLDRDLKPANVKITHDGTVR